MTARIPLRTRPGDVRFVAAAEIAAIQTCENYTEVHLVTGERLLARKTLKAWTAWLPAGSFVQVHRRTIINVASLRRWRRQSNYTASLTIDGCLRPVRASYRYLHELRALVRCFEQHG